MKITLADGSSILCENVTGAKMMYQGVSRDSLTIICNPADVTIDSMMVKFTPENCKTIIITDDSDQQFIHEHYTIRVGAGVSVLDLAITGATQGMFSPDVSKTEPKCWCTMVQTTVTERQLVQLQETTDALVIDALSK